MTNKIDRSEFVAKFQIAAHYMDDEKREQVAWELAPCTEEEFLKRYLEIDPEFEITLKQEFSEVLDYID